MKDRNTIDAYTCRPIRSVEIGLLRTLSLDGKLCLPDERNAAVVQFRDILLLPTSMDYAVA